MMNKNSDQNLFSIVEKRRFGLPKPDSKLLLAVFLYLLVVATGYAVYTSITVKQKVDKAITATDNLNTLVEQNIYNDHLALLEKQKFENRATSLEIQLDELQNSIGADEQVQVQEAYDLYSNFNEKVTRNIDAGLETSVTQETLDEWGQLALNQEFETLSTQIQEQNVLLDTAYDEYLATLPPPPTSGEGYSYQNVNTERGTFGVYLIKINLSEVTVKTVSAWENDCSDNCPTKSLQDYVQENNAYAGMNGSYFCPPDYSSCSGKVNSFDYAFYDSNDRRWFNENALTWFDTGMFTFNGSGSDFHSETSDYGGGSVTAGISNYPSLVKDGNVIVDDDDLTSYQKDIRGPRGAIGVDGDNNLYMAIVTGATVREAGYAMKALGVKYALNLDGGGSSSMFINGGYAVGPGRSLPNAIVIVR